MICITAPSAGVWVATTPCSDDTFLDNDSYSCAMRMRLGLPPANDDEMFNVCGSCGKDWKKDIWHPLACASHKGTWVTARHDDMKSFVELTAKKCGMMVRTEPRDQS